MAEAALEYAMAAGDEDRAARLVARLGQLAINAGRTETVRRWFGWFEDARRGGRPPGLAAIAALSFAFDGDPERAARWAELAARADARRRDDRRAAASGP